jgi:hypothetical protein
MIKQLTILLLVLSSGSLYAQLPKQVKQIDSICKAIDKDVTLKKKIYEQEEFMENVTDNGGKLTVYHKNNVVYKITEWVGLSGYVVINSYYFQAEKLTFVKDEEEMYEKNATGETTGKFSKENRFVGKYYFKNGKLFTEESLGHNRFEDDKNNPEKEFNQSAKRFLFLFKSK